MMKLLLIFLLSFSVSTAFADFGLNNIDKSDLEGISEEFSANFMHTSVSPASSLGDIFGIEVGVIGGVTDSPQVEKLVKEQDSSENVSQLPHAGLLGVISIPFGITAEYSFVPEQSSDNFKFETMSLAAKWTFTDVFEKIPFLDMAIKGHYSNTEFQYTDTINSVNTTVTLDQKVYGAHLVASADLFIIEPYVGLGFAKGSTDLGATGNVSIFDTTFSASTSESTDSTSSHLFAGLQFNLLFIHIAGEYSQAFGTSKYTAKFSLYF